MNLIQWIKSKGKRNEFSLSDSSTRDEAVQILNASYGIIIVHLEEDTDDELSVGWAVRWNDENGSELRTGEIRYDTYEEAVREACILALQ